MSGAKSKKRTNRPKARYGLTKIRQAAVERARASGRVDPFAATGGHARAPLRKQAGAS